MSRPTFQLPSLTVAPLPSHLGQDDAAPTTSVKEDAPSRSAEQTGALAPDQRVTLRVPVKTSSPDAGYEIFWTAYKVPTDSSSNGGDNSLRSAFAKSQAARSGSGATGKTAANTGQGPVSVGHGIGEFYVQGEKVYWQATRNRFFGVGAKYLGQPVLLGTRGQHGWVNFTAKLGGGRATLTALKKGFDRFPEVSIQDVIDSVRSPYRINANSNEIGIFIGGTGMHMFGIGNVERLYNLYEGTKFYYGGIGNPIDSDSETYDSATGAGWSEILDRAEADVLSRIPGNSWPEIHIFGWSRGAAMSVELARRLRNYGIRVKFLGLFDPVYSEGLPGQDSKFVKSTSAGRRGNYVTSFIPGNVEVATVIYAMNERRSWFPATKFTATPGTKLFSIASPGGHGEVGGHWQSNMHMQQLNLHAMIQYARDKGGATLSYRGLDSDLLAIFASRFTEKLVQEQIKEGEQNDWEDSSNRWKDAANLKYWSPYTKGEFVQVLAQSDEWYWWPGGYGAQKTDLPNPAKLAPIGVVGLLGRLGIKPGKPIPGL